MKALIQKKQEVTGCKDYRETTETTWYFLGIPIYHSEISIRLDVDFSGI